MAGAAPAGTKAAAIARVARLCDSARDATTLRVQVLHELRRVVGFDAYAWLLTDPVTSVGSAPLADVPCLPELPRLVRLKYLTEVNRWTGIGPGSVALLSEATRGDLARSLLWRDLLSAYDVGDVASVVFRDSNGCWGFLDLWRAGGPYTGEEAEFLEEIAAPVTCALRRCEADAFVAAPSGRRHRTGPVVVLLSPGLDVVGQTPATHEYLRLLVPPPDGRPPVPASAYNVAAQLLANEAGVDDNEPRARVHLPDGRWLTVRAARLGNAPRAEDRDIAVTIEESSSAERVELFSRAFALTPREAELFGRLTTGLDTRRLAAQMHLSEHTVQDHLKAVFAKTSTHSRRTLVSRALG